MTETLSSAGGSKVGTDSRVSDSSSEESAAEEESELGCWLALFSLEGMAEEAFPQETRSKAESAKKGRER